MIEQEFLRILRFYADCIESEDRRSLTRKLSALHHSVVSVWNEEEPLFHPDATEVSFDAKLKSDQKILSGGGAIAGNLERLFYGYPIFLDEDGFISPLFFTEVQIEHHGGNRFSMRLEGKGEIHLNHHVFRRQHTQAEELRAIQDQLEGPYGSFADRLRASFDALDETNPELDANHIDQYPKADSPRNSWVNRPIIFKSERSAFTYNLRRELDSLIEYPRLHGALGTTATGVIAGIQPTITRKARDRSTSPPPLIQVMPLNAGQEKAARAALEEPLSVITGPPGTGKSQVVVDLLASCALAGRPVLFASKNNKAVDVVRDRLRDILGEEQDWTLRLGSRNAMEESREEMKSRLNGLNANSVSPPPSPRHLNELNLEITTLQNRINELESIRNQYSQLERASRIAESMVKADWVELWESDDPVPDLVRIEKLTLKSEALAGERQINPWLKLQRAILPSRTQKMVRTEFSSILSLMPEHIRTHLEMTVDQPNVNPFTLFAEASRMLRRLARWRDSNTIRDHSLTTLNSKDSADALANRLEQLKQDLAEQGCAQLRSLWTGRFATRSGSVRNGLDIYFDLSSRVRQSRGKQFFQVLEQFKRSVQSIGSDFPVWIVTNLSVRNALPLEPSLFDLVIIDEASQCDIPSALPLLFRAKRALIIGDPQQLRHISSVSPTEEQTVALRNDVDQFVSTWSYNQRSIYALAEEAVLEKGHEPHFLAEHYRSHPEIIEFSNRRFYQGQLILRTSIGTLNERIGSENLGLFWHDVKGEVPSSSRSAVNDIEVSAVLDLLEGWAQSGFLMRDTINFGIVTPFRLQMERLEEAVRNKAWWPNVGKRLTVGTAHRFQGDERDVMIFSPVVSKGMLPRLVHWVSETDQLLNVAVTRARGALHVVGDLQASLTAGGSLADLATSVQDNPASQQHPFAFESPAETLVAELLTSIGLWFMPQLSIGHHRLDFLVISPLGTRYAIEVDGRGHLGEEQIRLDEIKDSAIRAAGYQPLRIDGRQVFNNEDGVRDLLRRLV